MVYVHIFLFLFFAVLVSIGLGIEDRRYIWGFHYDLVREYILDVLI